ncbi:MAG: PorV/PorQ family protein [Melioribacteraceae bacterium]
MRAITIKAVLILLTFSFSVNAQEIVSNVSKKGTTAAPFLSIAQGTRASGMGNAYVGVSDDPSALFWNPAGLTKVPGTAVTFERTNWIADINYNFFAASYNLGNYGSIGVSFISSEMDEMKVRTIEEPEGTGETFKANDVVISLGYAISLTENFSIGFNPKFIQQSIWKMSASAFALDMGVTYVTPFDGIVLAMSISNFGTKMKLDGTSSLVLYDPDQNSSGNNGNIPSYLQTDEWELPLNFRVGLAYDLIKSDMHKFLIAVDAMHPSDDYESVNIGGEYTFNDMISLRGGMKSIFLQDSEESFAVGVGIKQMLLGNLTFKIDYSYSDFGRLKDVQKFSLTIMF